MKRLTSNVVFAAVFTFAIFGLAACNSSADAPSDDTVLATADTPTGAELAPENTDPPVVGDSAPNFTLVSNEGNEVSLSEYTDQWVVLYFYPKDFTSGCTIQAKNFERDIAQFEEKNAVVLGVSVDSPESHKEFCTKEGLSFKLLSDGDGSVSGRYGSVRGAGESVRSTRNTFVINPSGVVAKVFLQVNPNPHSGEVLAALDELQQS